MTEQPLLSLWYSMESDRVYVETKSTTEKTPNTDKYLTEIKIGHTAHRTRMEVHGCPAQVFHSWSPFDLPTESADIIDALALRSQWVDRTFMSLKPAMAVRHPKYSRLFFFFVLGGLQRTVNGTWSA